MVPSARHGLPFGSLFQRIKRAYDPLPSLAQHMGVNHCRGDIIMPQKALDGPDIRAGLQKVCCKGMSESMGCDAVDTIA